MGKALAQLFSFFTTLFTALEKSASIIDNLATVGVEMSGSYLDEARTERQAKFNQLSRDLKASETQQAINA